MICPKCGKQIQDGTKFCEACGASLEQQSAPETTPAPAQTPFEGQQNQNQSQNSTGGFKFAENAPGANNGSVDFIQAIKLFFVNYVNFTGRASKSEYWWSYLFVFLASSLLGWIPVIGYIISLALVVPSISVAVRRFHDIGKPWYYYLLTCIPCAGIVFLICFLIKDSDGDNMWGPASK